MFSLKKLWDRWLADNEAQETPGRGNDYCGRQEPEFENAATETAQQAGPESALPDYNQWTPRLLTV